MGKHTPGPWRYLSGSHGVYGTRAICTVHGTRNEESPAREANGLLIAAAPDLLEALILARQELAGLPHSLGYDFTHLPKIDAAIRKATGEA